MAARTLSSALHVEETAVWDSAVVLRLRCGFNVFICERVKNTVYN